MTRRLIPALVALATLVACADDKPALDADLARDLELATAQPAQPQLNDGPEQAPEMKAPVPAAQQRTPTRSTSPARAPQVARRTPAPRIDTTTLRSQAPAPAVEVEQQSAPVRFRGIGSGASLSLATRTQVCTSNRPGDKLVATLTSAVPGHDGAIIPAGSTVVLEVASVTPGSSPESAQISLRVRSVVIDDSAHPVNGDVAIASGLERGPATANNSDKKKVIGGAIAGAVIGQVMGRDTRSTVIGAAAGAAAGTAAAAATRKYHACLPAGATVRATTSQPIAL
jgi:hypothetical protein